MTTTFYVIHYYLKSVALLYFKSTVLVYHTPTQRSYLLFDLDLLKLVEILALRYR